MFVNLENNRMFAEPYNIVKSGKTASNDSGFFISDCEHTGYNTPLLMLNGSTALHECKAKGKVISFFYFQIFKHFYSVMPYTENNVITTKISNCANTPSGATTEILQLISELNPYNSCFGTDYENLMYLFDDQMMALDEELKKGYTMDAKNRLNMMFSLFSVIRDKLPTKVFDKVEMLSFKVNRILK